MQSRSYQFLILLSCVGTIGIAGCAKKVDIKRPLPPPSTELTQAQTNSQVAAIEKSAMPEDDKRRAIATIRGQKDANDQAVIRDIMNSPKTTPEEKKIELELFNSQKNK